MKRICFYLSYALLRASPLALVYAFVCLMNDWGWAALTAPALVLAPAAIFIMRLKCERCGTQVYVKQGPGDHRQFPLPITHFCPKCGHFQDYA